MLRTALSTVRSHVMASKAPHNPLIIVLGATGTGKSQLAVDLALRFNGEVINGDAMQLYQGLPIVTNKVTGGDQKGVKHHLLGCIGLEEDTWRVGIWRREASRVIEEIRSRGKLPVVVGGTHYYLQSLVFGDSLVDTEGDEDAAGKVGNELSDEAIKEKFPILEAETEVILERLKEVDPVMAKRWHPNDRRKLRRSLEIYLLSGKRASDVYAEQKERKLAAKEVQSEGESELEGEEVSEYPISALLFWVHAEDGVLKKRLDQRISKMVENGLLDEVKSLDDLLQNQTEAGIKVDTTRGIWVSIGWKEYEPYLKALKSGQVSETKLEAILKLAIEQTQAATRQYAKRQLRWIRLNIMPALADKKSLDNLYLLDSSDVSRFEEAVSKPAIKITEDFLEGKSRPSPQELSPLAKQYLAKEEQKPDVWFRKSCDLCHMTAVTDLQWQEHIKSRRHRGQVKRKEKNAGRAKFIELNSGEASGSDTP